MAKKKEDVSYFDNQSIPTLYLKDGQKISYEVILPDKTKPIQSHLDRESLIGFNPIFIDKYTKRKYALDEVSKWRITTSEV